MLIFNDFFAWRGFFCCFESIKDLVRQFGIISALAAVVAAVTSQQELPGAFCHVWC